MTADYTNQVATAVLLSTLVGVLALGLMTLILSLIYLRRRSSVRLSRALNLPSVSARPRCHPSVFEHSCRWIVVKGNNVPAVQAALGLHNPIPCSWGEGLSRLTNTKLFVAPPVRGWILAIGHGLPDPNEDVDRCFHFILRLSRALGHVQFYSVNRALNYHAWVRAEAGHIVRAYAWAGDTLWNQGTPTPAEVELGLQCPGYGEPFEPSAPSAAQANVEKIMALAGRWSFDPASVDETKVHVQLGVAGDLTHSRRG